jgi:phosphoglycerate kinase
MDKAVINQLALESLRGRRVFVRIDAHNEEPWSGPSVDESKLRAILPTLAYLTTVGARALVATHIGNPGAKPVDDLRVNAVAERLSQLTGKTIRKLDEAIGRNVLSAVMEMQDGEIAVLENLCFYPGETANDETFARALAELCDIYCDDAFPIAYRGSASTVGITRYVRPATAGLAFARELTMFEPVLDQPEAPFAAIVAGARIEEKLPVLDNLLTKVNRLFFGGALAFTFLRAQGREIGAAWVDDALVLLAENFLWAARDRIEILLPEDFIVVHSGRFKAYEKSGRQTELPEARAVLREELTSTDLPVDIGPRTLQRLKQLIHGARTFFWNGPLGICEIDPFSKGTRETALALLEAPRSPRSVVCGDSLTRAIRSFDLPFERIRHLSNGGASALQLLAGNPLPAVAALDNEVDLIAPIEKRSRKILLAVDGSPASLEAAKQLGGLVDTEGADISLFYVRKPAEPLAGSELMDAETKRRREIERRLEAERILAAANAPLARQGLVSRHQMVVEGDDPADEILKRADEIGAELIAMGSHGRSGFLEFFLGSVSRKVLDRARCPVLVVRSPSDQPGETDE